MAPSNEMWLRSTATTLGNCADTRVIVIIDLLQSYGSCIKASAAML